jgi:N-methylhydantoinase B
MVPETMRDRTDELEPGDGILINDPAVGAGSIQLPDVALLSPPFVDGEIVGYAANAAHHVDVGGGTPGGVPTDSTELYGEGLILPGIRAVRDWSFDPAVRAPGAQRP